MPTIRTYQRGAARVSLPPWQEDQSVMICGPLLPPFIPSPKGGRRRSVDDRAALNGILFVLQTGIPWEDLPKELGWGSGMTCWRRLRHWQANRVWAKLHQAMLSKLREHDRIDWSRASIDSASVASPRGPGDRPEPDRPGQARQQASPCRRCAGHPAGSDGHGSEPARLDGVRGHARCAGSQTRLAWQTEEAPGQVACGQGLRLRALQALSEATRHPGAHRSQGH